MKKNLFIVLIVIFIVHFLFRVYSYRDEFLLKFDSEYWKDRYLKSQWVVPNSKESVGDDGLYAHVGWEYIHGRDPTTLNAEIPPLGKYFIGLSEIIFTNQNIFALLSGIFVLVALFFFNRLIFKDNLLAFLPVFIFSFDPLFYMQLRAPYLDLLYLGFLLLTFVFFLKERFMVSSIFLGCMIATKASASTFVIVTLAMVSYLLLVKHKKNLKKYILSLPVALFVFLLTYAQFFLQGHSLKEFLGVQKWILTFYSTGAKGDPLSAFQILLSGTWPTWWDSVVQVPEWTLLWPISFIATVYYLCYAFIKRKWEVVMLSAIWVGIYLLFLTLIPVWPRYLLLALPFMYNLAIWILSRNIRLFSSR